MVTLKNQAKVIKILTTLPTLQTSYLSKFGHNQSTGSEDKVQKRSYADADTNTNGIHTKNNLSALPQVGGGGGHNQGSPALK